jgi:epoxyqueuosine reductase
MENNKYCDDICSSADNINEMIKLSMSEKGYAVEIVSIEHLRDIQKDIEILKSSELSSNLINLITNDFYSLDLPDVPFKINSIIITASPKPLVRVKFNLKNKAVTLLHHTYVDIDKTEDINQNLKELLNGKGYHLAETASLPQKLLAVRSGLAKYGRNNLTYVEGMGSLQELSTFYSDIPCAEDNWHEIRQMDLCKACMSCVNICPTAAITKERYLIRAERCLTYLNEFVWPTVKDFPSWLDSSAHNCIHGCILCQTRCPQNKKIINKTLGPIEFNEYETLLLLEEKPLTELPEELIIKLKILNLADDYFSLLPRNLKLLFDK